MFDGITMTVFTATHRDQVKNRATFPFLWVIGVTSTRRPWSGVNVNVGMVWLVMIKTSHSPSLDAGTPQVLTCLR